MERKIASIGDVARVLKTARKAKGLTQRDLAEKVGMPQGHISKIEAGAVDLQATSLVELARVLDLEVALIPKRLIPAVRSLAGAAVGDEHVPMHGLDGCDGRD